MDITTLIGIAVAFGLVIISILMGGDGSWFINYPSVMIVLGGTMGATLLSFPLSEVLGVFKVAKNVFLHRSQIAGDCLAQGERSHYHYAPEAVADKVSWLFASAGDSDRVAQV